MCEAVGEVHGIHATTIKGLISDPFETFAEIYCFEAGAIFECAIPDAFDAFRKRYGCNFTEPIEGRCSDGFYAAADYKRLDGLRIYERVISDGCDIVLDNDIPNTVPGLSGTFPFGACCLTIVPHVPRGLSIRLAERHGIAR